MPAVEIVPMKMEHVEQALVVLEKAFGKTRQQCDVKWGVDAPSSGFKTFADDSPASEEEKNKLSKVNAMAPGSSRYFVSLKDGKVTGVSGNYRAVEGYTKQIGAKNSKDMKDLETPNTYWLSWFAVDPDHQKQGIGDALTKRSVEDAVARAKNDGVPVEKCTFAVEADPDAIPRYAKFGCKERSLLKLKDREEAIMSAPLNVVALNLGIRLSLSAGQKAAVNSSGLDKNKNKLRYVMNKNIADDHAHVPGKCIHNEAGISLYATEKKDGLLYVVDNDWVTRAKEGVGRNTALQIPAESRR